MVRLRQIPRSAAFAWSPGHSSPFLATGTHVRAVDVDFSNETFLELWDLKLDGENVGAELQPVAKISTESRFHDLGWAETEDSTRGLIAGALENGALNLWDAAKLLDGSSSEPVMKVAAHSGAVKTLQFHPRHSNLLASGGSVGELFITDLNNIENPTRLGKVAASQVEIDCLDWNKKVPHILATGNSDGFVTVWDAKAGKESLTLKNLGRKPVSAIAWDPEKPTRLVTSIPLETDPVILVWDLRNANAPERVLKGHESGVLSLSWCPQDPRLLLSSGEDNRNICWNPQTGEAYGEFPIVTNATFQTRFNPTNPNILATASLDGKISVQTLQNTNPETAQKGDDAQPLNDEDFFAKAQTQPQGPTFSLPKAPKWFERPATANFGFGGRVISVVTAPGTRTSTIRISKFEVDASIGAATDAFESALSSGDVRSICESRAAEAKTEEERSDWKVMTTLMSETPRKELITHLGFSGDVDEAADSLAKLGLKTEESEEKKAEEKEKPSLAPPAGARKHKRLTSIFDTGADGESDSFLTDLSASKAAQTNSPFQLFTGEETEADKSITKALIQGQFDKALEICLKEDRMADALMIALSGGQDCIDKAQEAYFLKICEGPSYIRLLASIAGKDIWDVVHNADLKNWKEIVAVICTFADDKDYPELCEALGDRLEEYSRTHDSKETRKDASFCYLASSKLEKVVSIWIQELKENESKMVETASGETGFSIHVQVLRDFIEKVTVFRQVSKFVDAEKDKPSDWKLTSLYDKYIEYAEIVATHGRLDVAEKYLSLLPDSHPAGGAAKNRIQLATKKATTKAAPKVPASHIPAARQASTALPQPSLGGYTPVQPPVPQQPPMMNRGPTPNNPYAPPAFNQPANPYAPSAQTSSYAPTAGYQPTQQPGIAPPLFPGQQAHGVPPPPRGLTQSPSTVKPHTERSNVPAWNDLPEGFARTPTPRRGTPSQGPAVISSPFPNQQQQAQSPPPPPGPPVAGHQGSMPVPPPPKGPFPAVSHATPPGSAGGSQFVPPERPSSTANLYAPPPAQHPPTGAAGGPPHIARSASPYTPPPAGAPPSNRYAPVASAQPSHPPGPPGPSGPPGPPQQAPGPSPYGAQRFQAAPPPQGGPPQGPYAPQGGQFTQPPPPPHTGAPPRQDSRPSTGQSQKKAPTAPPKHPAGDRSHIPDNAKPIFEILSADMQRVKARAPSSFKAQVNDTERRLNILFDHLNNEDLLKPATIDSMVELARAIQSREYEAAQAIHLDILTNRTDECGNWMVGVKRLIGMSKATP
ncbi:Steroid receptor RNA activator-protein/coat protein complex II, Sec31 [Trichophyton interdigitale]|nr:Steroid receptor RNA activator-protein/coat protein complex II, Sec31 [Trichophyton interdigitale]KAG5217666.1 Steroid receptor RNA activator-protein/coat protein complex II, Sec31 [Trichophyton interdigitale]KAG8206120.1 Steroid receptor RNA activator-protein/coat protein complex II, Sec31 [Trichophyton interdigitale]